MKRRSLVRNNKAQQRIQPPELRMGGQDTAPRSEMVPASIQKEQSPEGIRSRGRAGLFTPQAGFIR